MTILAFDTATAASAVALRLADGSTSEARDDPPPGAHPGHATRLLEMAPPPLVPFQAAWEGMSPMARSFWAENRLVRSARTQATLGLRWRYPSFREGLRAILVENGAEQDRKTAP